MDKIISSPKYGWYMNKVCKILILTVVLITILCLIVSVIGMCVIEHDNNTKDDIRSMIIVYSIALLCDGLFMFFYIRQLIFEKKLKLWQQDFVKLYAKVLGGYTGDEMIGGVTVSTVIKFRYEGKEHEIKSKPLYSRFGESKGLQQIGQKVPIYYSPKYDEIVFIKES